MTTPLTLSMTEAWMKRAEAAAAIGGAAIAAPALFRPDALERARRDYMKAIAEARRWNA